ncbi:GNAT family N-acetyltransferase [Roseovarius sp. M141]|uniref:GNAT family N-acetyltransferase n=1 Tax=Roseovarius sp. M141 TaxID=2583806 RepID=UPI0020CCAEEF|nr:GNAT family protein [Roseovarius sp. M141]MCQ0090260.1 GNAT family N-acetyltransferase [Roseovarius sp. M141]
MSTAYRIPDEFETRRYRLRRVTTGDASAIFNSYAADVAVTRYLGWRPHGDSSVTEDFIKSVAEEWRTGKGFPLVVFPRDDPDNLIGMFHPHVGRFKVNYGYVLAERAWGYGCATEVLTWLVEHAITHPSIHRTEAFCDVDNRASSRVMEKVGMTREGLLSRYFLHPNVSKTPRDCFMYAKVR